MELNSIEEVVEDLKKGKCVVIMDDENRENEGDVICAAEFATTENVNFMASYARGLICMPMAPEYTISCICHRCVLQIQTITAPHFPYRSIM